VGGGHDGDLSSGSADRVLRRAPDAAELVRAAVEADGFTFIVAHGISANRYRRADLQDTMQQLSYRPVDDAWSF
jgi:hypothetical protein